MAKAKKVQQVQFCNNCKEEKVFEGDSDLTNAVNHPFIFCVECGIADVFDWNW